jgi:hypothetical protein
MIYFDVRAEWPRNLGYVTGVGGHFSVLGSVQSSSGTSWSVKYRGLTLPG